MPTNNLHLANRVLNQPLLLEPCYARTFFSALSSRLGINQLIDANGEVLLGEKMQIEASSFNKSRDRDRPYQVIDGVAVLPISGTLVHKYGYMRPYSGMTGYDGILARVSEALEDPEVKGILLDCDTPGGEVSGCFDAAQMLRAMVKDVKPLWAIADDMFCSAGMAIASAADRRLITQSASVGSVGVVMAHTSYQEALKEEGLKVTLIHSGSEKVMGNPYEDLSKEALQKFQSSTDKLRKEFAQIVSEHCNLSFDAVMSTEAATFRGAEAIEIGFADEVVNGNQAVSIFAEYLKTNTKSQFSGVSMSDNNATTTESTKGPETNAVAPQIDQKARISGIINAEESKGRETLANHFAFKTDMSVEQAKAALSASPAAVATAEATGTKLDQVMANEANPNIGDDLEESAETDEVGEIVSAYNLASGAA